MGESAGRAGTVWRGAVRGMALGLGAFALVSLVASWVRGGGDANLWWIDAAFLPAWVEDALIAMGGVCMVLWAIRPGAGIIRRAGSIVIVGVLLSIAVRNAMVFYRLWADGTIRSSVPVPVSLLVAGLLVILLWRVAWPAKEEGPLVLRWTGIAVGLGAFAVLFPLAQILLYGQTDYRRRADAIVVLGAKTLADGRPSQALADRVRTGVQLYGEGLAPLVIMSGGPGDGATHETVAMERLAVKLGVPKPAIVRDELGLNTAATMRNVQKLAEERHLRRVLAVSHSWHLSRIKLAAGRSGLAVYTVPCQEARTLAGTPLYMAREVVAFWKYYITEVLAA